MKKLFKLFKSKTPKVGRKLAGIGIGIAGLGITMEFTEAQIIEFIPEEHRIYYIVSMRILEIVGGIFITAGGSQTKTDPDKEV